MVDSLDLKSSGIYSRGGSSPPEATINIIKQIKFWLWIGKSYLSKYIKIINM